MRRPAKGQIHERITAIPNAWYPAYIVKGRDKSLMIDAGLNLLAPRYLASIRCLSADTQDLDYLFLTHSHYDHVGAAPYLRLHIPGLKLGAHEGVARLMRKPSVLQMMNRLSANHADLLKDKTVPEDLTLRPFEIDIPLKHGDEFDLGELTCIVLETPGHTRDSLSFYVPELEALFPGEACGILQGRKWNTLLVMFLNSYMEYVDSLKSPRQTI